MNENTPSLVTIAELRELLKTAPYQPAEDETEPAELLLDKESGLLYTDFFANYRTSLVLSHLLAELCFENPEKVDFKRVTAGYNIQIVFRLASLYLYPLTWIPIPPDLSGDFVIQGRIAKEIEAEDRYDDNLANLISLEIPEQRIINFAKQLPTITLDKNTAFETTVHNWLEFLADFDPLHSNDSLEPDHKDPYFRSKTYQIFDRQVFTNNLNIVAEAKNLGKPKAAEIVHLLRLDWPYIQSLKLFGYDPNDELLRDFESFLFDGINCFLSKWEEETPQQPEPTHKEPKVCKYICREKINEIGVWTVDEYTRQLKDACAHADTLAAFLYKGRDIGYLRFHGESVSQIYKHLKECFPESLKFGYGNFTQYFKK